MEASSLKWFVATETRRSILLLVAWASAICFLLAQALYQRAYLTIPDSAALVTVCFLGGMVSIDFGKALLGYLGAMIFGLGALFLTALLPTFTTSLAPEASVLVLQLWVSIIFRAIFPFQFIAYLVASIIGSGFGEKYL